MSVAYDNKTNTYYAYFEIRDRISGKRIVHKKRGFTSERKARKWEQQEKDIIALVSLPFDEMANQYFNTLDCTIGHLKRKQRYVTKYFPLHTKDITRITKLELLDWNNQVKKLELSTVTINTIIQTIKAVYRFSNTYYDVPNISGVLTSKKITPNDKKEMQVWDIDTFNKFLACVDNPIYHAYFRTLFWTGIRRGEGIALLKEDLQGGYLNINKSMRNACNGANAPKTLSSVRKVKLDTITLEELQTLLKRKGKWLFGDDTPLSATNIQRYFDKAIKLSGVTPIRIHDLRHSHATILINNGVNIVAVSKRLGHSDISMTLNTYTHLLQKTDEKMMIEINKLSK